MKTFDPNKTNVFVAKTAKSWEDKLTPEERVKAFKIKDVQEGLNALVYIMSLTAEARINDMDASRMMKLITKFIDAFKDTIRADLQNQINNLMAERFFDKLKNEEVEPDLIMPSSLEFGKKKKGKTTKDHLN
jgi:hypothetical protein